MDEAIKRAWTEADKCIANGDAAGALFLFKRIADLGEGYAYFEIANLLEHGGSNLKKDIVGAIEWYKKAFSAVADEYAAFSLGRLYFAGIGVDKDYAESFNYFYHLRDSKEPGALYAIGMFYEQGWGIDKSSSLSERFYEKAARLGHVLALWRYGLLKLRHGHVWLGLKCLVAAEYRFRRVRKLNPEAWQIGIRRLSMRDQEVLVYKLSLP